MNIRLLSRSLLGGFVFTLLGHAGASADEPGLFEGKTEIGKPSRPGSVTVEPAKNSYLIAGGGENMWFTNDAFYFVWKRVSGDFELNAATEWVESGGNAHRKACLIVRQSLDADSPYIDVAVHGDGLTSLQFRETPGGLTHEIQANVTRPPRIGIGRQGDVFFMTLPEAGDTPAPAGASMRIKFSDPVYVGLGVCAHDDKALETARFSQVRFSQNQRAAGAKPVLHCTLEVVPIGSKDRRVVYHTSKHIEAPNWSRDGQC